MANTFALGTQELLIIASVLLLVVGLLAMLASAVWVYRDATARRNKYTFVWTLGTLLVWPWVFVVYLIVRGAAQVQES